MWGNCQWCYIQYVLLRSRMLNATLRVMKQKYDSAAKQAKAQFSNLWVRSHLSHPVYNEMCLVFWDLLEI